MTTPPLENMSRGEILYHLLKKERGYYDAILEQLELERGILDNKGSISALTTLNRKKQLLFTCIEEIEAAIHPLKKLWHSESNQKDLHFQRVKEELEALDILLKKILQEDQANQKQMRAYLFILKQKKQKLKAQGS